MMEPFAVLISLMFPDVRNLKLLTRVNLMGDAFSGFLLLTWSIRELTFFLLTFRKNQLVVYFWVVNLTEGVG